MGVASPTTAVVFQMHAGETGPVCRQRQVKPVPSETTCSNMRRALAILLDFIEIGELAYGEKYSFPWASSDR